MKFPLTVCVFLLTVSSSLSVDITVTGTEGGRVRIKCPYPEGYEKSSKYFYKGIYKHSVLILQSDGVKTSGRFSLKGNRQTRLFTVTISDLRMEDAGPYGCRAGWGEYKKIQLNVIRAPETKRPVQISTSTIRPFTTTSSDHTSTAPETKRPVQISTSSIRPFTTTSSDHTSTAVRTDLASVAGGLGSVLLVLTLCSGTFLIRKKRKRKSGTALFEQNVQHNTETDHIYEEIPNSDIAKVTSSSNKTPASSSNQTPTSSSNQMPASSSNQMPASSSSQMPASHLNTCPKVSNIKSPEATQDSRTELIYATATHPQNITRNEGPIYSVINH